MTSLVPRLLGITFLFGSVIGAGTSARADLQLQILNSSQAILASSSTTTSSYLNYNGNFSSNSVGYQVQFLSAFSNSPGGVDSFGNPSSSAQLTNFFTIKSNGAGTLVIDLASTGFSVPAPTPGSYLFSSFTVGSNTTNVTAFGQSYADAANTGLGNSGGFSPATATMVSTGQQGPFTVPGGPSTASAYFSYSNTFSMIQSVTVTFGKGGGTLVLSTESDVLAPEPSSLTMIAAGLPLVGFYFHRRRTRSSKTLD